MSRDDGIPIVSLCNKLRVKELVCILLQKEYNRSIFMPREYTYFYRNFQTNSRYKIILNEVISLNLI